MTIHYSVESLPDLFVSDSFQSDKKTYGPNHGDQLNKVKDFLNYIEINKNYYRTGLIVKNPRYKKKTSQDTVFIKSFKTSLNKISSLNYLKICPQIVSDLGSRYHLYPLIIQYIFEQSLLHHTYCKYYGYLVELLHKKVNNLSVIESQIQKTSELINKSTESSITEYSNLCSKNKQNDQLIGYSIFLAELELKNIISGYIDQTIQTILDQLKTGLNEDESYKCIMCLYTLWKVVYQHEEENLDYINQLNEIKSTIKFMKVKFKIMDILEKR